MTDTTARFALPHILPGQAQKELYHNEALTLADALLHPAVEDVGLGVPPGSPVPGQCWIVGAAPSGDWNDRADALAIWTGGGWRFANPVEGMAAYHKANGVDLRFDGASWVEGIVAGHQLMIDGEQLIGARAAAIADLGSGADPVPAINAILAMLRTHGLIES